MKELLFTKMAAAGNDFVVVDARKTKVLNGAKLAKKLCDRKFSVGADGVLLLETSKKADVRMRIFNPDGSEAEMCGNGVRCLAKFAADKKAIKSRLSIETIAGLIEAEVRGDVVKAKMVQPKELKLHLRVSANGASGELHFINTGVPHVVQVLDSLGDVDVQGFGKEIRFHRDFAPRGTNADFIRVCAGNAIEIRTYERGVEAETLACGTGSTAGALVAAALKGLKSPVSVRTRGGEVLKVYFSKKGNEFYDVYLEGLVQKTFEGRIAL
jgi:diaminopimelate epimerase